MKNIILVIVPLLLLLACEKDPVSGDEYEYEEEESLTLDVTTQTELIVENTNGSVTILGSDTAASVQIEITKKVRSKISERDAQSHISSIDISHPQSLNSISLIVSHPANDDRNYEINLDIILPNNFNYDLSLGNGTITITSGTKEISINLGNGTIESDLVLTNNCSVGFNVGNGTINLKIPGSTDAMLVASVGNGSITNNGLSFQNQQTTSKTFSGRLGNGNGNIVLSLGNGSITMSKNK